MAVALGELGLAPEVFWAMTPAEFEALVSGGRAGRGSTPERATLADMMARFPDRARRSRNHRSPSEGQP